MLVGGIGLLDLRIAGAFRSLPLAALSRALTPLALAGLALVALSGPVLFAADAQSLIGSATFRWKLLLIGVALANAAAFRWLWHERVPDWGSPPAPARLMAGASLGLWLGVGTLGRLIAYS